MNRNLKIQLGIAFFAALFFLPFIGRLHLFDWDEINFAECAREMIVSKNFLTVQIDYMPFWEKPPLFIWMQVLAMKVFGINEFAARLPNAVCGIVTLLVLFNIGKRIKSETFGLWWTFVYTASILPQMYFRSGIIDPWFNLFIFMTVWCFILYSQSGDVSAGIRRKWIALAGASLGLAIMTKGPVALLIMALVFLVFYIPSIFNHIRGKGRSKGVRPFPSLADLGIFTLALIIVGGSWFVVQLSSGHYDTVREFIIYQVRLFSTGDAGHGGHWSYHIWILSAGVFPASILSLSSFRINKSDPSFLNHTHKIMLILFWVVLILFSIVKTKIVHYSSLCYFPITFLATMTIDKLLENKIRWRGFQSVLLLIISILAGFLVILMSQVEKFKSMIIASGIIKDDFAVANLKADVHWSGFEAISGILLIIGTISAIVLISRNLLKGILVLLTTSLVFIWLATMTLPYKIEQYSQGALIEFLQSRSNEDCYIRTMGFKSYAKYFYTKTRSTVYNSNDDESWLVSGKRDKPCYYIMKLPEWQKKKDQLSSLKLLYEKNGFVFLKLI